MSNQQQYTCLVCNRKFHSHRVLNKPVCCHSRIVVEPIVKIRPHPIAKKLRIAECNGEQLVVGNHYEEGTLGFHIPVGLGVPDKLLEEMWLKNKLSGPHRNIVTGRTVASVFSNGLFYGSKYFTEEKGILVYHTSPSWNAAWVIGDDIGADVGITVPVESIPQPKYYSNVKVSSVPWDRPDLD